MKNKKLQYLILSFSAAALFSLLVLSLFVRLHADDFCMLAQYPHRSLGEYFSYWYTLWTGRFMMIFFSFIFQKISSGLVNILPAILILLWLGGLYRLFLNIFKAFFRLSIKLPAAAAALIFLTILFNAAPNLYQVIFWQNGMIAYTFPLVGFTWMLVLLFRLWEKSDLHFGFCLILFLFAFVNGGFAESFSAMQVTAFACGLLLYLIFIKQLSNQKFLLPLLGGFFGACIALIIVRAAPGNEVRMGLMPETPGLVRLITFSLRNTLVILVKFMIKTPLWALAAVVPSFVFGWFASADQGASGKSPNWSGFFKSKYFLGCLLWGALAVILILSVCAPVVYVMNAYPDDRTIFLPTFVIVLFSFSGIPFLSYGMHQFGLLSFAEKNHAFRKAAVILSVVIILITSALAVFGNIKDVPDYQDYAQRWDKREQGILTSIEAGEENLTAFGLESRFGLADLQVEPDSWVNKCMADYYGVESITGK